jgi:glycosyltransferase involved in cell wall biosynthesis
MNVWIVEVGEPLPILDGKFRDLRCGILSKKLAARGNQVLWWASNFDHWQKRNRFDLARTIQMADRLEVRLLAGSGYGSNASPKRLLHNRSVAKSFKRESTLVSSKPDVVFCCLPTLELCEAAVEFGHANGVPVVIDVRDIWPDHYLTLVPGKMRSACRLILATEFNRARRVLAGASAITAVSESFLAWALRNAGRERSPLDGVFHLGYPELDQTLEPQIEAVRQQLFSKHNIEPQDFLVTFVGSFCSSYALDTVINAARVLDVDNSSHIKFVIAGSGDEDEKLRKLAQGLRNVIFTGWLDQISIVALLRASMVGLAPYRSDASQSLPNKPFEYMSAGLPILSSLRGELETLLSKHTIGVQYPADDAQALVESIRQLAATPQRCRSDGARALKLFKDEFSEQVVYSRLIQHLEKIASCSDCEDNAYTGCLG